VTADSTYTIPPNDTLDIPVSLNSASLDTPGNHVGTLDYTSNDVNHGSGSIPVTLYIYQAEMSLSRLSIADTLAAGETGQTSLIIINGGPGRLNFDINASTSNPLFRRLTNNVVSSIAGQGSVKPLGHKIMDPDKGGTTEPYYPPIITNHGGPDSYGHKWVDSDDAGGPAVGWIDISSLGTPLTLTDDIASGAIPIGFAFPFFENSYSEIFVGSNGLLTFGAGSADRNNSNIPSATSPNNLIAMWWDDLNPSNAGHVFYYHDIQANRFIVSFDSIPNYLYPSGTGSLNFQAVLYPTGKIILNYGTMNPGTDNLNEATIGIENSSGTDGLGILYNAAYMHSNLTIVINTGGWLSVSPTSGNVAPYSRDTIDVVLDASELTDGTYTGQLLTLTNDPDMDTVNIPVTLIVGQASGCNYMPGDINGDNLVLAGDVTYAVRYFKGLNPPPPDSCWDDSMSVWLYAAGDVNGSCEFRGSDVTLLVAYFKGIVDQLRYCPRTPPVGPLILRPGLIWDKDACAIKKDYSKKIESNSLINTKK
jgi:hypothetical protein